MSQTHVFPKKLFKLFAFLHLCITTATAFGGEGRRELELPAQNILYQFLGVFMLHQCTRSFISLVRSL